MIQDPDDETIRISSVLTEDLAKMMANYMSSRFAARNYRDLAETIYDVYLSGRKGFKDMSRWELIQYLSDLEGKAITEDTPLEETDLKEN